MEDILKRNGTLSYQLIGRNGNAFALMAQFSAAAERAKWSQEDIKAVTNECMSGDYDHLLRTLITFQA